MYNPFTEYPFRRITTVTYPDGRVEVLTPEVQKQLDALRSSMLHSAITGLGFIALAAIVGFYLTRNK